jgi:hypothetical protein
MASTTYRIGTNADGSHSICRAKPENVGKGRCHHTEHRTMTGDQWERTQEQDAARTAARGTTPTTIHKKTSRPRPLKVIPESEFNKEYITLLDPLTGKDVESMSGDDAVRDLPRGEYLCYYHDRRRISTHDMVERALAGQHPNEEDSIDRACKLVIGDNGFVRAEAYRFDKERATTIPLTDDDSGMRERLASIDGAATALDESARVIRESSREDSEEASREYSRVAGEIRDTIGPLDRRRGSADDIHSVLAAHDLVNTFRDASDDYEYDADAADDDERERNQLMASVYSSSADALEEAFEQR